MTSPDPSDKPDILNRGDIERLIINFYTKAREDKVIGHFFNEVIPIDWAHHIPKICDFWETTLLGSSIYTGNPMQAHLKLNQLSAIKKEHFDRWLALFQETLDELFSGEKAALASQRAISIAMVIQIKLAQIQ